MENYNEERLEIDYAKIDDKVRLTVQAIEKKGHVIYIRYLLTKRFGPDRIRNELKKMGLSSPHEVNLRAYFDAIIWPAVEKFGIQKLYNKYRQKMCAPKNTGNKYAKNIMNYRIDLGQEIDLQPQFLKFLKYLDVDTIWMYELHRYYGTISNFPVDENGERILAGTFAGAKITQDSADRILRTPKRYLIDKLILEGVQDKRIAQYCKDELGLKIYDHDIKLYKKVFFNLRVHTLEEKIKSLDMEKKSLEQMVDDLKHPKNAEAATIETGDKIAMIRAAEQRIKELTNNLFTLNAKYNQSIAEIANGDVNDIGDMMGNMITEMYHKFVVLSQSNDRDVVVPLSNLSKNICLLAEAQKDFQIGKKTHGNTDQSSKSALLELVKDSTEKIASNAMSALKIDDIGGVDELSISYSDGDNGSSEEAEGIPTPPSPMANVNIFPMDEDF